MVYLMQRKLGNVYQMISRLKGGFFMKKEDILLKSKNDNRNGDELQVQNKQNAEMFGYGSVMFVLFILMIMGSELVSGEVRIGSLTMMFEDFITLLVGLSLVCEFGAKFYFTRKWWQLLLTLIFLAGIIAYFVRYQL